MTTAVRRSLHEWVSRLQAGKTRPLVRLSWLMAPALGLTTLFIVTGLRGVNFGFHWDEREFHVIPIRKAVESGILLPRAYIYPSFEKWILLWATLPAALRAALATDLNPASVQKAMLAAFDAPEYLLDARSIFIVVSSLSIVWVYGAALALRMKWWVALVAASGLGLSWQFAYHARFAVADGTLVQFTALTLFMLALFLRSKRSRWLYAAAIAAGFATGTKYPGVFLLLPLLLASFPTLPLRSVPAQLRRAALLCPLAFAAFLLTTPGVLLDPFNFISETRWISNAYMKPHGGYTAAGGWNHARIALTFLAVSFFSPNKLLAVTWFIGVVAGIGLWFRADRRVALTLACFPLIFLAYFCGKYRIVVVRNYLFITPFLCLFFARTLSELDARLSRPWLRRSLASVLAAVLLGQAIWLVSAAESIRHVDPKVYVQQALAYVAGRPERQFRLSPLVHGLASAERMSIPANITTAKSTELVYFGRAEGPTWWGYYQTNNPWLTEAVFGPREVDFNWYSTWSGNDRVVVMSLEKARAMGIAAAK